MKLDDPYPTLSSAQSVVLLVFDKQPYTLTIKSGDEFYETLLAFAHVSKADLIMMLPQMRNWFQQLVSQGETQRMARLTDIPLLAVI